jgi:hypothetical protein
VDNLPGSLTAAFGVALDDEMTGNQNARQPTVQRTFPPASSVLKYRVRPELFTRTVPMPGIVLVEITTGSAVRQTVAEVATEPAATPGLTMEVLRAWLHIDELETARAGPWL